MKLFMLSVLPLAGLGAAWPFHHVGPDLSVAQASATNEMLKADVMAQSDLRFVGSTKDACEAGDTIRFAGKGGDVHVSRNESKLVELAAFTNEVHWYCGGSRERCANDQPFNWVRCERAGNGAIVWTFYAG